MADTTTPSEVDTPTLPAEIDLFRKLINEARLASDLQDITGLPQEVVAERLKALKPHGLLISRNIGGRYYYANTEAALEAKEIELFGVPSPRPPRENRSSRRTRKQQLARGRKTKASHRRQALMHFATQVGTFTLAQARQALPGFENWKIVQDIFKLQTEGELVKTGHGSYALPDREGVYSDALFHPTEYLGYLVHLRTAKTAAELVSETGDDYQQICLAISTLLHDDRIKVGGIGDTPLYAVNDAALDARYREEGIPVGEQQETSDPDPDHAGRTPGSKNAPLPTPRKAVMDLARTGAPFTAEAVKEKEPSLTRRSITAMLKNMVSTKVLRKLPNGTFTLATGQDDPSYARRLNAQRKSEQASAGDSMLDLLHTPRTVADLSEELGLSRSRVGLRLRRLQDHGLVVRKRMHGAWTYARTKKALDSAVSAPPNLKPVPSMIVASLPDYGVVFIADIMEGKTVSLPALLRHLRRLQSQGLVEMTKLGNFTYVELTEAGAKHPAREGSVDRLPAIDLKASYGAIRTDILTIIDLLAPIRSLHIRYALTGLEPDYRDTNTSLELQMLRRVGLVASDTPHGQQGRYRLGPKSHDTMKLIRKFVAYPSKGHLEDLILKGEAAQRKRLSTIPRKQPLNHLHLSLLGHLRAAGTDGASLDELRAAMTVKIVPLLLGRLRALGLAVEGSREEEPRPAIWRLTDKGAATLQEAETSPKIRHN